MVFCLSNQVGGGGGADDIAVQMAQLELLVRGERKRPGMNGEHEIGNREQFGLAASCGQEGAQAVWRSLGC